MNSASAIRGPTWSPRFYFSISQDRGLRVVWTPRGFLPSKIQIWTTRTTTTSDSLSATFALTLAPVSVRRTARLGRTRVRVIGNGDQSPSNHGRTMRVAPPESGRPRKSYCYHPRCLSRPMSTDASKTEGEAFRVIQDCSFDRWCDLWDIFVRVTSNDDAFQANSSIPDSRVCGRDTRLFWNQRKKY